MSSESPERQLTGGKPLGHPSSFWVKAELVADPFTR